jgi:hypothetical protein
LTTFACENLVWLGTGRSDVWVELRHDADEDDSEDDNEERPPAVDPAKVFMFMQ